MPFFFVSELIFLHILTFYVYIMIKDIIQHIYIQHIQL